MSSLNLEKLLIDESASLREAMARINENRHGMILVRDETSAVCGLATDGDIRRQILAGASLDLPIGACANRTFVWAGENASRETILKQLDNRIRLIPVLDAQRRLTAVVSRDDIPLPQQQPVYVRARAPARVSFGGGGSDLTHYFSSQDGAVINAAISLYCHATLRVRPDSSITIKSSDLGATLHAANIDEALRQPGSFGLFQAILQAVRPDYGFELHVHSDFPMGSGLGGSATVTAAVLGCFNQMRQDRWDLHELSELAFQAERLHLGIAGGWQDQYATVFGGFNFMEFRMDQNIVHPLRIPMEVLNELEESLVLCDTGIAHESGNIHEDQRTQMQAEEVRKRVASNVELTYRMRNDLLRNRLLEFGRSLDEAWQIKRRLSSKITSDDIDRVYDLAREHGAEGGKLLGAGGGGFFLFYARPFRRQELVQHLTSLGLRPRPFRFEPHGVQAWTVRDRNVEQK